MISKKKRKYFILHGPNLNLLGEREIKIYGSLSLIEINKKIIQFAEDNDCKLRIHQSNSEGSLIDLLHENRNWAEGIVFNPGAYSHYSYAIRDAISSVALPTVEVHLTAIGEREDFRKTSVIAAVCVKQISGLGWQSYIEGLKFLLFNCPETD